LRPGFPFYSVLAPFYEHGHSAVQVFWVVSGFVFMRRYRHEIQTAVVSFEDFALRRFSRLYPLHFATLIAVAVMQQTYTSLHATPFIYDKSSALGFASQLFMASNWFHDQPMSFNGPIWSVSSELLIYGLFFAVLCPINVVALKSPIVRTSLAAMVLAFFSLYVPLFSTVILTCGSFFMCGCFAERVFEYPVARRISALVLVISGIALALGYIAPNGLVMMAVASSAVMVCGSIDAFVPAPLLGAIARLGNTTYSSYLLHFPLQLAAVIVVDSAGVSRDVFMRPAVFMAYIGITFGAALVTYQWFELPMQRWLRSSWRAGMGSVGRVSA